MKIDEKLKDWHYINKVQKFISDYELPVTELEVPIGHLSTLMPNHVIATQTEDAWKISINLHVFDTSVGFPLLMMSLSNLLKIQKPWFKNVNAIRSLEKIKRIYQNNFGKVDELSIERAYFNCLNSFHIAFCSNFLVRKKFINYQNIKELAKNTTAIHEFLGYNSTLFHHELISDYNENLSLLEGYKQKALKIISKIDDSLSEGEVDNYDLLYTLNQIIDNDKLHIKDINKVIMKEDKISDEEIGYDIAISFAGEDRNYVKELSSILSTKGVRVFYDEFEKSSLWGKDLYEYLSEIYSKKAFFCLMVISKHYSEKAWSKLERKAAQSRALIEENEYILPLRLDSTEIPGIFNTIGYLNANTESIESISNLIIEKLNSKQ